MPLPSAPQVATALYGAWRLLLFDSEGNKAFEKGAGAFWQSFFAALITLPGYAVLVLRHLSGMDIAADGTSVVLLHLCSYVMSWTAFPLIVAYIAAGMGHGEKWPDFVIALNWSKTVQMAIYLPLAILATTGVFGQAGGAFLTLAGFAAILIYQWFVTKVSLGVPGTAAAGLTFLDVIVGLMITTMTDGALLT